MRRPILATVAAANQTVGAVSVGTTRLQGRTQVLGVGEVSFDVDFPIKFIEVPHLSFGAELDKTSVATATKFPTVSVCVTDWRNEDQSLGHEGLYIGASLGVVVGGQAGQAIWVHWTFDGKALRTPLATKEGVDDVL